MCHELRRPRTLTISTIASFLVSALCNVCNRRKNHEKENKKVSQIRNENQTEKQNQFSLKSVKSLKLSDDEPCAMMQQFMFGVSVISKTSIEAYDFNI